MEQNILNSQAHFDFRNDSVKQQWNCQAISENEDGCFDCSICLDAAQDPVVTFCGHLYCWPCIYKWIHVRNSPAEEYQDRPTCPVCKANISARSLIPLYGRGRYSSTSQVKDTKMNLHVPRRPTPAERLPNYLYPRSEAIDHSQHYPVSYADYTASLSSNPGSINDVHPAIGLFGEMVYTRIFGSCDTRLFAYPNSSALMGRTGSRRMRRQEMKLETSLNRLSVFLLCCIIICLILF